MTQNNYSDWSLEDTQIAQEQGWSVFMCDDGKHRIQRIDDPASIEGLTYKRPKFKSDEDAVLFVINKAHESFHPFLDTGKHSPRDTARKALLMVAADTLDPEDDALDWGKEKDELGTVIDIKDDWPNNFVRSEWAMAAVRFYAGLTGLDTSEDGDGLETAVGDLLNDIHHLARREGLDIEYLLDKAARYAADERLDVF